jgi:hypothetical protein
VCFVRSHQVTPPPRVYKCQQVARGESGETWGGGNRLYIAQKKTNSFFIIHLPQKPRTRPTDSKGVICARFSRARTPRTAYRIQGLFCFLRFSHCAVRRFEAPVRPMCDSEMSKILASGRPSAHNRRKFEVATTMLDLKRVRDPRYKLLPAPERICITDPKRSCRRLYVRLETWLARAAWEAYNVPPRREVLAQRLSGEVHYIQHLRKKRPAPCPACPLWLRDRLAKDPPAWRIEE